MKKQRTKSVFPNRDAKQFKEFKWTFKAFIFALLQRLRIEKDVFVLITGDTGSGKSHLTGNFCLKYLAKELNFIRNDGSMIFEKSNFIIDPGKFAVKMITEEGSALWIDEGRDSVNRQKWFSEINQTIASRKNRNRKKFNIYFLCMPYETEIDPKVAKHLTLWLWVRRGVVEVYCKSSGKKGGTGLDIQKILEREAKWLKENPKANFVLPYIHPEFLGRIFFKALTEGYRKDYEALVEENKASGELSEEEKLEYGIIEKMTSEGIINKAIDDIKKGSITNKRELWINLKEETGLPDDKLQKQLNFYLKLEGYPTFNKLFEKKKKENLGNIF